MKRLFIGLVLIGALAFGVVTSSAQTNVVRARNNTLNVREGPGLQYAVIGRITSGGLYSVVGQSPTGNWLLINFMPGQQGYVHRAYVVDARTGTNVRTQTGTASAGQGGGFAAPTTSSTALLGQGGGFAAPRTTTTTTVANADSIANTINSTIGVTNNLNIRTGPGISNRVRWVLPYDERAVPIARNAAGSWLLIDYRGIRGWVSTRYVIFPPAINPRNIPVQQ